MYKRTFNNKGEQIEVILTLSPVPNRNYLVGNYRAGRVQKSYNIFGKEDSRETFALFKDHYKNVTDNYNSLLQSFITKGFVEIVPEVASE